MAYMDGAEELMTSSRCSLTDSLSVNVMRSITGGGAARCRFRLSWKTISTDFDAFNIRLLTFAQASMLAISLSRLSTLQAGITKYVSSAYFIRSRDRWRYVTQNVIISRFSKICTLVEQQSSFLNVEERTLNSRESTAMGQIDMFNNVFLYSCIILVGFSSRISPEGTYGRETFFYYLTVRDIISWSEILSRGYLGPRVNKKIPPYVPSGLP